MNTSNSIAERFPFLRRHAPAVLKRVAWRMYWFYYDANDALVACVGLIPSHTIRLVLYRTIFKISIGSHTSVHMRCRFYNPSLVTIGNNSIINCYVLLDGRYPLTIGDNVSISEEVMLLTLEHDPDSPTFANRGAPIVVENRVFIGTRALILPGVTIGEGAVVGAGAVVTRDVEPYTIVAGVPARFIRQRSRNLEYKLDYRKLFS
jgi:acetyltransferase-like isoleucine patch superfamily enzyme